MVVLLGLAAPPALLLWSRRAVSLCLSRTAIKRTTFCELRAGWLHLSLFCGPSKPLMLPPRLSAPAPSGLSVHGVLVDACALIEDSRCVLLSALSCNTFE
mmetsp:Transcript_7085/g.21634  ORF Transcript_7085/g.21634 Transcript_7085/m.21634 type:complete len:100 (+) Transcript_7085:631-930(+)